MSDDPLKFISDLSRAVGGSKNDINISLGGHGLGIASCVIMLVAAGFLALQLSDARDEVRAVRAELREHGHQLNAIYRVAPGVEREVRARIEEDAKLRSQAQE